MVRRSLSIFLLAIFLFNVVGYYGIFWLARQQSNAALAYRIDSNGYTVDETITIKFPISLPYPIGNDGYERIKGSFQHQGEFYKLIKQKLEKDTLYVVCIKDHQEKKLFMAMADYTKASNDLPATSKTMKLLGSFVKDFEKTSSIEIAPSFFWHFDVDQTTVTSELLKGNYKVPSPPPWLYC